MNHYDTLGVNQNANQDEIKKAWKKAAAKHHPDRNPGNKEAETKFKEAQAAYATLSDSSKRKQYDIELQFGTPIPQSQHPYTRSWRVNVDNFSNSVFDDFEEVLRATSGARTRHREARRSAARPGSDVDINLSISLEEAAQGCTKQIEAPSRERITCPTCLGKRATKGARVVCSKCMGSGRKLYFNDDEPCDNCGGLGDVPKYPCEKCNGQGFIIAKKKFTVKIPAGISDNHKLRLTGMGNPGQPSGDLFITVRINEHPIFKRVGQDLYINQTVPIDIAMIGGTITIPSLNGKRLKVDIPERIEPGQTIMKVIGAGIKDVNNGQLGHLFVTLQVQLPELKTDRAKKLFEELIDEISNR